MTTSSARAGPPARLSLIDTVRRSAMLSIPSIGRTSLSVAIEPSGLTVGVFPDEVDLSNASAIRDQLLFLVDSGSTPLALDLTGTRFCDCAGVGAIIRVDLRATAQETPFCLV